MVRKDLVAMLLAGGQGSRLGVLTKNMAKPAVFYGGKYRIIDFTLSNCINSGIDTVGVLTQYLPLKLNSHIGIGKPWDMDRINGGVTILSPYLKDEMGEWYKGTANAVFQNIHYLDKLDPEYVIILSGDHIYKMDYSKMLDFHKEKKSDITISVIDVPYDEASRYGIMNTHPDGRIYEFEEKPKQPKSTLASMGIYIFNWKIMREYLVKDSQMEDSESDFGKNIIPEMLKDGKSMWAYKYSGYWRDVGTIQSFWESNMDLIARVPEFNLFDPAWRIYTPNPVKPAHFIAKGGIVKTSIVAEGCEVYGKVRNSVLFPGVIVGEGAVVEDSIVMSNTVIGKNTIIDKCIIDADAVIGNNCSLGVGEDVINEDKSSIYCCGITVVGESAIIPDDMIIGKNVMIDAYSTLEDYKGEKTVSSGKSIYKGGVIE